MGWSHLWILLWCPTHLPAAPSNHLLPPPLLHSRHQGLRHLLLHHGLLLHPLQPPRLPHPVRPLRGVGHLSPPPPPAHRAGRPPPALPAQAARARPASGRPRKLGRSLHQHCLGPISKPQPPPSLNLYWNVLNHKSIVYVL